MAVNREEVGLAAMEAMDELEAGGDLDVPSGTLRAVAVIVAVDHGDKTTINYRFRSGDGGTVDKPTGQEMLRRVQETIG